VEPRQKRKGWIAPILRSAIAVLMAAWPILVPTQSAHAAACAPAHSTASIAGVSYRIVSFTAAGSCAWAAPASVSSVEALVVGGGGGGGDANALNYGGGGGGGAVVVREGASSLNSALSSISIKVGAGGAAGANGAQSEISAGGTTVTVAGGVRGGDAEATTSGSGGSSGNGFSGGADSANAGGGGGGAATAGSSASGGTGGAGGSGLASSFTGAALSYGGGGGGGASGAVGLGGAGGGGDGAEQGEANTGGGGGGATNLVFPGTRPGAAGGSGIVVLRYALLTPAVSLISQTPDGFTANITNYTANASWSVSTTAGVATLDSTSGLVTVTGLSAAQTATLTVSVDQDTRESEPAVSTTLTSTALQAGLVPEFEEPVSTEEGFTVEVSNYLNDYTWLVESSEGEAELDSDGILTVSELEPGERAEVEVTTSRVGYTEEADVIEGQAWFAALTPQFGPAVEEESGFRVTIENFDRAFSWTLQSSAGRASLNQNSGVVSVKGLADGASASVSVSSTRDGYATGLGSTSGSALRGALVAQFGPVREEVDGFRATIVNFDQAYDWTAQASAGVATLRGAEVSVTGLEPGEVASVAVVTTREGYRDGSSTLRGAAKGADPESESPLIDGSAAASGSDFGPVLVNDLGPVLETLIGPLSTVNIFSERTPIGPILEVSVELEVDTSIANTSVSVDASNMMPGSPLVVTVYSTPTQIAQGVTDDLGNASIEGSLPDNLPPGVHTLEVMGVGEDGAPAQSVGAFELDEQGVIVAAVAPGQTTEVLEPGSEEILRALEAGAEIYDPTRFPTETAALAVAAAASVAALGAAARAGGTPGGSAASRTQSSGGESEGAELGSIWDEELEGVEARARGAGDRSRIWRHRHTKEFDQSIADLMVSTSRWIRLPSRLIKESTWARTQFGEYGIMTWLVGIALGVLAVIDTGALPLPPALWILLGIIFVGILDGMAGALAWIVIASASVLAGNLSTAADVRSLMGIFVLVVALPLVSSAARPLRRPISDENTYLFDRVSDYVVASVVAVVCGTAMYTALNGLSGLEIVPLEATPLVQAVIVAGIISRGIVEDVATRLFPRRLAALSAVETDYPPKILSILSVVLRAAAFVFVATSFLGVDVKLILIGVLFAGPLIFYVFYDELPNSEVLFRWLPRGMAMWLVLTVLGILTAAWILGRVNPGGDVIIEYAIFFLPWALIDVLFAFGKEGKDWPDTWLKRIVGIPMVVYTSALLMGWVGFFGL
jgi:hypothetical protein